MSIIDMGHNVVGAEYFGKLLTDCTKEELMQIVAHETNAHLSTLNCHAENTRFLQTGSRGGDK